MTRTPDNGPIRFAAGPHRIDSTAGPNWPDLLADMQRVDDRDIADAARRWASTEAEVVACPANVGEWKASMEVAFHAGMMWAKRGGR